MPVIGASRKAGTNSASPSNPRKIGSPVMSKTCLPRKVICPMVNAIEQKVAPKSAQSRGSIRPGGLVCSPPPGPLGSWLGIRGTLTLS